MEKEKFKEIGVCDKCGERNYQEFSDLGFPLPLCKCHKVAPPETSSWENWKTELNELNSLTEKIEGAIYRIACNHGNVTGDQFAKDSLSVLFNDKIKKLISSVAQSEYKRGVEDGRQEVVDLAL